MKKLREIALAASSGVTQYFPQIEGQIIVAMLNEIEAARAMRSGMGSVIKASDGHVDNSIRNVGEVRVHSYDLARAALDELLKGDEK